MPPHGSFWRLALGLAIGAAGGALFARIGAPLPWMIGPIVFSGIATFAGLPVSGWRTGRVAGMLVLGTAVGLYFTPQAAQTVLSYLPVIVAAGATTLVIGVAASFLLARTAGVDRVTAFFCSVPGGIAEMSIIGERFGGKPLPIAVMQLLRVVTVTILIPSVLTLGGAGGHAIVAGPATLPVSAPGLIATLAFSFAVSALLHRLRFRNAWLLGPMAAGCVLGISEAGLSAVPTWLSAAGQVLIGTQIGSQFERSLMSRMRRFIPAAMLNLAVLMAGCAAVGLLVSRLTGIAPANMILATSPGGVTEMCITAKVLGLDVPIIVAFHLVRIFLVILSSPFAFRLLRAAGIMPAFPDHAPSRVPAE